MLAPPPVIYAPEMPLAGLRTAELLLTTTLRLFALPWRSPGTHYPNWAEGLAASGAPSWAKQSFQALLGVVVVATRRPLDVRCPHCRTLGYDEGRLLQIIALLQRYRADEAEAVLGDWLPPAAVRLAADPAAGLAVAMKQAGLVIPHRHQEAASLESHPQMLANPGLALVH